MASRSRSSSLVALAVAALAVDLSSGESRQAFRILPAGEFSSWDGRPTECAAWVMTDEDGRRLVAEAAARQSDFVIDYDHQTLRAKENGKEAVAAGWYKSLEWRPGDGLYIIEPDWTALAAERIEAKEFRYVSPVFSYDKQTGRVLQLYHAALTNNPGVDGLTDLAALAADFLPTPSPEEKHMDELLEQLRWLLNLPVGATAADVQAQLQKLIDQLKSAGTAAASFDLAAHLQERAAQVAALSAQVGSPDPARFVPVASFQEVQAALAALSAQVNQEKVDGLIAGGLASGKLVPSLENWARGLGTKDVAALSAFLDGAAPVVTPGSTQTGGQPPAGGGQGVAALSAETLKVCEQLGVSAEDYRKTLAELPGA